MKILLFEREEGKELCYKRDMENIEELKEDLGKDGNLIFDYVCNNSSLESKYGYKDR